MSEEKTPTILSILKWYAIVIATLTEAILFVEMVNVPDSLTTRSFIIWLPATAYLWSLVSRKVT